MKKRRRSEAEDSSLELLLDTMCNTFGCVMFIAIMLFVLVSEMVQQPSDRQTRDPEEIYRQIRSLKLVLSDLQQQLMLKTAEMNKLLLHQQDSRHREIALLEKTVQEKTLLLQTTETALKTEQIRLQELRKDLTKKLAMQQKKQLELEELKIKNHTILQELQQIKKNPVSTMELTFKMIEPGREAPFFLILTENTVYPVGPWKSAGSDDAPDPAVEATTDGQCVRCTIRPGAGYPVLADKTLSPEFSELLKKIPPDRVPKFFIYPNAAATAFRMREILKKNNIRHGCTPAVRNDIPFVYEYKSHVEYEY